MKVEGCDVLSNSADTIDLINVTCDVNQDKLKISDSDSVGWYSVHSQLTNRVIEPVMSTK